MNQKEENFFEKLVARKITSRVVVKDWAVTQINRVLGELRVELFNLSFDPQPFLEPDFSPDTIPQGECVSFAQNFALSENASRKEIRETNRKILGIFTTPFFTEMSSQNTKTVLVENKDGSLEHVGIPEEENNFFERIFPPTTYPNLYQDLEKGTANILQVLSERFPETVGRVIEHAKSEALFEKINDLLKTTFEDTIASIKRGKRFLEKTKTTALRDISEEEQTAELKSQAELLLNAISHDLETAIYRKTEEIGRSEKEFEKFFERTISNGHREHLVEKHFATSEHRLLSWRQ